jgi:2-(1,2-epoxy-1,2-dihydrophenyl)acetyl-CoA isomerase
MESHTSDLVLVRTDDDGILWVTLNRPESRNAINRELRDRLLEVMLTTAKSEDVRAVVIRGNEQAFSAGGDIKEIGDGQGIVERMANANALIEAIAALDKPVIAGIQGHAAGAGFSIALVSDLVVADTTAIFSCAFVKRALVPDLGATYWLPRHVGVGRAKEIIFSGRFIGAEEAKSLGFVSYLCSPDEFQTRLEEVAREYANGPTTTYGLGKRLIHDSFHQELPAQLLAEAEAQQEAVLTADHQNAIAAFREKREATFTGK